MEDLGQQLQHMLSDPQSLQQLQGLLRSLGQGTPEGPAAPIPPDGPGGPGRGGPHPPGPGPGDKASPPPGPGQPGGRRHPAPAGPAAPVGETRQKKVDEAIKICSSCGCSPS